MGVGVGEDGVDDGGVLEGGFAGDEAEGAVVGAGTGVRVGYRTWRGAVGRAKSGDGRAVEAGPR